jgi:hypothetical protein
MLQGVTYVASVEKRWRTKQVVVRCLNHGVAAPPATTDYHMSLASETVRTNSYRVIGALVCCCMSS